MNAAQINTLIEQNGLNNRALFSDYDPVKGIGSPIQRIEVKLNQNESFLLPKAMDVEFFVSEILRHGALDNYATATGVNYKKALKALIRLRIDYDFEFWCATCAKIQDKQSKQMVPFILRKPQRKLLGHLMAALYSGTAIRVILLKARQWGGSTLVQIFMAWIQLFHKTAWHSIIVADVEDQARNIRAMYTRLAQLHPIEVGVFKFRPFEGSTKNRIIQGRGCINYVGSMQKPDSIRSADVAMAHLSEVGLWQQTKGKKPQDLVQAVAGTIPNNAPYSMIVIESTAKGIGNYFHQMWQDAVSGASGYDPVFVAWFEIEMYYMPFKDHSAMVDFIETMTDMEHYYFSLGATLEGVQWYRHKKHSDALDDWRMACEFPTTAQEAFQSTGRRAHAPSYISQMRKNARAPQYIGELFADANQGVVALGCSLEFKATPSGDLHLWALPDKSVKVSRRYVVSVDIGGRSDGADFSVISIIDRYYLIEGGVEECIGTWRSHLDQDLVIWKAAQIAKFFCDALLVVESNSLNDKATEGDHSITILDEIKDFYPNIFCRTDPQKLREGLPAKYGFHTNIKTKTDLVNQMNKRFRDQEHIEYDARALDEADYYEIKPNGSYGAIDGKHDDIYMSRAIGLKASQLMDLPAIIKEAQYKSNKPRRIRTEADF